MNKKNSARQPRNSQGPMEPRERKTGTFHIEFLNAEQKNAWKLFVENDVIFCLGAAGCGKTFLSTAYACQSILTKDKKKITLTRPIIESQESLGFLPGTFSEKVAPYLMPMYDSLDDLVGKNGLQRDMINQSIEISPIAYQRGRAETLDSPVLTPFGFIPMGQLQVGDKVIGSNGKPIAVTGVFPQGKKKIYKVSFTDKTFVKCSGDHLWSTMTLIEKKHKQGFSVKTTEEILNSVKAQNKQKNHKVPILSEPVQFNEKETDLDPYCIGIMAGNLGIKEKSSFIAEEFKINSVEKRLEILRGLMDASGNILIEEKTNKATIQYETISFQLAQDIMFIVRSLGGMAFYRKVEFDENDSQQYKEKSARHVNTTYIVDIKININPFKLEKSKKYESGKHSVFSKLISAVEYIGEEECQCISVDSIDHLYVTNGFNITHNTHKDSICLFDEAQNATYMGLKLFLTRIGNNAKLIINGDPAQSDLRGPVALIDIVKRLEGLPGIAVIKFSNNAIVRHPLIGPMLEKL